MWNYRQPVEICFEPGGSEKISQHMEKINFSRAILVCDPFHDRNGLARKLADSSNGRIIAIYSDVEPNPTIQNVEDCVAKIRESGAECIVALGGGSSMDCAKSAAAAVYCRCTPRELMEGRAIEGALPLLAIPTTAGTGSEVTAGAVLSDPEKGEKAALFSPHLFARMALVDSKLTYTCPPAVTASSGIDVLMHALDAMSSVKANPATDTLALRAAKLVLGNLEAAYRDGSDTKARDAMSAASVIAGMAFSQTGTTGSHACSYILTAKYHLPHGEACAFTADAWIVVNAEARPELKELIRELGFENAKELANEINRLKHVFQMRTTFKEAGIPEEDIEEIVDRSLESGNMANNIAQIGRGGVQKLFESRIG